MRDCLLVCVCVCVCACVCVCLSVRVCPDWCFHCSFACMSRSVLCVKEKKKMLRVNQREWSVFARCGGSVWEITDITVTLSDILEKYFHKTKLVHNLLINRVIVLFIKYQIIAKIWLLNSLFYSTDNIKYRDLQFSNICDWEKWQILTFKKLQQSNAWTFFLKNPWNGKWTLQLNGRRILCWRIM